MNTRYYFDQALAPRNIAVNTFPFQFKFANQLEHLNTHLPPIPSPVTILKQDPNQDSRKASFEENCRFITEMVNWFRGIRLGKLPCSEGPLCMTVFNGTAPKDRVSPNNAVKNLREKLIAMANKNQIPNAVAIEDILKIFNSVEHAIGARAFFRFALESNLITDNIIFQTSKNIVITTSIRKIQEDEPLEESQLSKIVNSFAVLQQIFHYYLLNNQKFDFNKKINAYTQFSKACTNLIQLMKINQDDVINKDLIEATCKLNEDFYMLFNAFERTHVKITTGIINVAAYYINTLSVSNHKEAKDVYESYIKRNYSRRREEHANALNVFINGSRYLIDSYLQLPKLNEEQKKYLDELYSDVTKKHPLIAYKEKRPASAMLQLLISMYKLACKFSIFYTEKDKQEYCTFAKNIFAEAGKIDQSPTDEFYIDVLGSYVEFLDLIGNKQHAEEVIAHLSLEQFIKEEKNGIPVIQMHGFHVIFTEMLFYRYLQSNHLHTSILNIGQGKHSRNEEKMHPLRLAIENTLIKIRGSGSSIEISCEKDRYNPGLLIIKTASKATSLQSPWSQIPKPEKPISFNQITEEEKEKKKKQQEVTFHIAKPLTLFSDTQKQKTGNTSSTKELNTSDSTSPATKKSEMRAMTMTADVKPFIPGEKPIMIDPRLFAINREYQYNNMPLGYLPYSDYQTDPTETNISQTTWKK